MWYNGLEHGRNVGDCELQPSVTRPCSTRFHMARFQTMFHEVPHHTRGGKRSKESHCYRHPVGWVHGHYVCDAWRPSVSWRREARHVGLSGSEFLCEGKIAFSGLHWRRRSSTAPRRNLKKRPTRQKKIQEKYEWNLVGHSGSGPAQEHGVSREESPIRLLAEHILLGLFDCAAPGCVHPLLDPPRRF